MRNNSFVLFTVFLLLISATNLFSQAQNDSKFEALNRPRVSESGKNAQKIVNVFELEKLAFVLINQRRAAKGLSELAWNDDVARIARIHSQNMADNQFFNHRGLDGLMVGDRANSVGIRKWQLIGENIAFNRGYAKPTESAVESWMQSSGHRENILSESWEETGIGVAVTSGGSYYFTQVFLLRK